jgi:hypothetical protein
MSNKCRVKFEIGQMDGVTCDAGNCWCCLAGEYCGFAF